ncbi:MAG: mandelate racemase/muconate lactonizing enzyme family protein [Aggregatilineales bacterium]
MKIVDVNGYVLKEWRTFLFIVVETDAGIYGIGEAGLTGRELAMLGALNHIKPLIIGLDAFATEHIWQMLFRGGFFPAQRIITSVIAAIDMALWDIKGKALDVPVYQLLGGRVRDKVVCYPHTASRPLETLAESCRKQVDEGWKFIRWGLPQQPNDILEPHRSIREAIRQFEVVRREVGEDIHLCFDVHTRLDLSDAVTLCREVEQFHPYFIEDPLRVENSMSYKSLRERTTVPLAAGEQYSSKWEFREVIEHELIDYARIDLAICGGITEAKKIAGWCETHYIRIAVHNPIGPVSTSACLHLNLSLPNFGVQELPRRPGESLPDLILNQPQWEDGYLLPPEAPGLGIEINLNVLEKYAFDLTHLPMLKREDGTFTNW